MKKPLLVVLITIAFSCSNKVNDQQAPKTKIVCGDSFEMELFDDQGNPLLIKMPGKCDTIVEAESH